MNPINRYIDHAVLKPEMNRKESEEAIKLGLNYETRTVCVRPCDIELAQSICQGSNTDVCVVLGFPHGCALTQSKRQEAESYAKMGVAEVDMVSNYGFIRSGDWAAFEKDVESVFRTLKPNGIMLKVILEISMLKREQIAEATRICAGMGVGYVKTSTGFNGSGATIDAIATMLAAAKGQIKVKASGGIRDIEQATAFIEMGCERIGVGFSTTPILCDGKGQSSKSVY